MDQNMESTKIVVLRKPAQAPEPEGIEQEDDVGSFLARWTRPLAAADAIGERGRRIATDTQLVRRARSLAKTALIANSE